MKFLRCKGASRYSFIVMSPIVVDMSTYWSQSGLFTFKSLITRAVESAGVFFGACWPPPHATARNRETIASILFIVFIQILFMDRYYATKIKFV